MEVGAGDMESIIYRRTKGPFNGTVRSDGIVFSEGLHLGKTYRLTVEFATGFDLALVIHKELCKKAILSKKAIFISVGGS